MLRDSPNQEQHIEPSRISCDVMLSFTTIPKHFLVCSPMMVRIRKAFPSEVLAATKSVVTLPRY